MKWPLLGDFDRPTGWSFTWAGLVTTAFLAGYAALRQNSIIGYSKKIRDSLLTQIHASSSVTNDMSSEERDKLAKAFQRPEKPLFAKTHQDKAVLPVLALLALLGVSIPSYMVSPAHTHYDVPQQQLKGDSERVEENQAAQAARLAEESERTRRNEEEARQQALQAAQLEAEQKAQAEHQQAQLPQQGQLEQQQKTSAESQSPQEFTNSKVTIRNSNPSSQAMFNISGSTCNRTLEVKLSPLESRDVNCKGAQHYEFGIDTTKRDGQVAHRTALLAAFEVFEVFNDNDGVWNIRPLQRAMPLAERTSQPAQPKQNEKVIQLLGDARKYIAQGNYKQAEEAMKFCGMLDSENQECQQIKQKAAQLNDKMFNCVSAGKEWGGERCN